MIRQCTHMSQTPALPGVVATRAAGRVRTAPVAALAAFCSSVLIATDAGGITTPHRRPPIE
jgi:hypothetical protein